MVQTKRHNVTDMVQTKQHLNHRIENTSNINLGLMLTWGDTTPRWHSPSELLSKLYSYNNMHMTKMTENRHLYITNQNVLT